MAQNNELLVLLQWHKNTEEPDPKEPVIIYNKETQEYEIGYYKVVGTGYIWAYWKEIFPKVLKENEESES